MSNMNIYVGNLATSVTETELKQLFAHFGQVNAVTIKNDRHFGSGKSSAYGYVEMPSTKEGCSAIAGMNGKNLKGRVINMIEAMPMSSDPIRERRRRGRWS